MTSFERIFYCSPQATSHVPGRVNLMGEHTDYNQGFVLPTVLPLKTTVQIAISGRSPSSIEIYSDAYQELIERRLGDHAIGHWSDYVIACLNQLHQRQIAIPALKIAIDSKIPLGKGLSSSAALEIAIGQAMRELLALPLSNLELAFVMQQAEQEDVGIPCGIMDQMVCALGQANHAFFLDTQNVSFQQIPLSRAFVFVVVDSGTTHQLVTDGYRQRRQECEVAAQRLQAQNLRQVSWQQLEQATTLSDTLQRRVQHVMTENQRVLAGVTALQEKRMDDFGALMNASHHSQKVLFEVTVPQTDRLCEVALTQGALGARQTGGGFGGAIVALLPVEAITPWWHNVAQSCPDARFLTTHQIS